MSLNKSQKYQILSILTSMFFLGMAATDIYIPSLPKITHDFSSTPVMVNLTLSGYTLAIAIATLFVGEISNVYGRKNILLLATLLFGTSGILIAIIPHLPTIIFFRIIQGVGCAIILVVPRLILKDCMNEREQIAANGILLMGLVISPAIAPIIGAYLAKYFGWQSCFWFVGITGLVLTLLGMKFLPETHKNRQEKFHPVKHYIQTYKKIAFSPLFLATSSISTAAVASYFAFIGISSYLFIRTWHMSPELYSSLYIWVAIAYLAGNQLMQFLNHQRYSSQTIIRVGVIANMIGWLIVLSSIIVMSLQLKIIVVIIGLFFMRSAVALINPPVQIAIMREFENHSAQAIGLAMFSSFAFNALSTSFVSLFHQTPYFGFIFVSGLFAVVCYLMFFLYTKINHV